MTKKRTRRDEHLELLSEAVAATLDDEESALVAGDSSLSNSRPNSGVHSIGGLDAIGRTAEEVSNELDETSFRERARFLDPVFAAFYEASCAPPKNRGMAAAAISAESFASVPEASDADADGDATAEAEFDIGSTVFDPEDPYGEGDCDDPAQVYDHELSEEGRVG